MLARMPMTATTIMSSIKVKPLVAARREEEYFLIVKLSS